MSGEPRVDIVTKCQVNLASNALVFDQIFASECEPMANGPAILGKVGSEAEDVVQISYCKY